MTDGVPPHSTVHPMRAMFKIPFLPPPTLMNPAAFSDIFNDFIEACLVKDHKRRPTALDLKKHPFISHIIGRTERDIVKPLVEKVQEVIARREAKMLEESMRSSFSDDNLEWDFWVTLRKTLWLCLSVRYGINGPCRRVMCGYRNQRFRLLCG
ncbi:hypothetical protein BC829DRAFT_239935 [Chytridium lagenaria]|nr:hypothetical protein BC829DRAFT_239935 [Chytridium lagenaria]